MKMAIVNSARAGVRIGTSETDPLEDASLEKRWKIGVFCLFSAFLDAGDVSCSQERLSHKDHLTAI